MVPTGASLPERFYGVNFEGCDLLAWAFALASLVPLAHRLSLPFIPITPCCRVIVFTPSELNNHYSVASVTFWTFAFRLLSFWVSYFTIGQLTPFVTASYFGILHPSFSARTLGNVSFLPRPPDAEGPISP